MDRVPVKLIDREWWGNGELGDVVGLVLSLIVTV